ncbi:MAG: 2,3-bisphosphoglycerate-independent phosphoglycerate mutase [Deltaproteobacteria bacterium]|nr:2,3-bisphosphoglycerate-independent phosphoglycerate mutase [Deltaproteobacteria bacterium]
MRPVVLVVLDGYGVNPDEKDNATRMAGMPVVEQLSAEYPTTELTCSGLSVGLPEGQMGNSEVGHLTLGSGRVVYQELTRINKAVEDGSFSVNPVITSSIDSVKDSGDALHLMGLLSDGGVHSHIDHLEAILKVCKEQGLDNVFIHCFLDGRDTAPRSGAGYVEELQRIIGEVGVGRIATVTGRYYAMDRDKRWERVLRAYDAITSGEGTHAIDPLLAVKDSYAGDVTDEFVLPVVIVDDKDEPIGKVKDGDAVFFYNFRSDRAREITSAMAFDDFDGFKRDVVPKLSSFSTLTEYEAGFGLPVAFPPGKLDNLLGTVISDAGVKQFRVTETEKYAHVTFFFNGGVEEPFKGEERLLIPSIKDVPTYDLKPEMRAADIAKAAVEKIASNECGFILINFANLDMVGHTGVLEAAIDACKAVDTALGSVTKAARENGWAVLVTSDHGNAEQMKDNESGSPHTAHTTNKVPFILIDDENKDVRLRDGGGLSDVAPTVLKVMGLKPPPEMTGKPLF